MLKWMGKTHAARFWAYFAKSRPVRVVSAYSLQETRRRMLQLNEHGDVQVRFRSDDEFEMIATAHAGVGARGGTPVIPVLRARLLGHQGHVVIEGRLGIDAGIRLVLAIFGCLAVLLPLLPPGDETVGGWVGSAVIIFLFIFGYNIGERDLEVIERRLSEATAED